LELRFEFRVAGVRQEGAAAGEFQEWDAFMDRTSGDGEEVLAIGFGEVAVAFGDVGRNGREARLCWSTRNP